MSKGYRYLSLKVIAVCERKRKACLTAGIIITVLFAFGIVSGIAHPEMDTHKYIFEYVVLMLPGLWLIWKSIEKGKNEIAAPKVIQKIGSGQGDTGNDTNNAVKDQGGTDIAGNNSTSDDTNSDGKSSDDQSQVKEGEPLVLSSGNFKGVTGDFVVSAEAFKCLYDKRMEAQGQAEKVEVLNNTEKIR